MTTPHHPMQPINDPVAAMERMKDLTRSLLSVPKKELDKAIAKEKTTKKRRK